MYEEKTPLECMRGNSLIAFLLGAAVGAGVALLYAPMSGSETRAHITDKANQAKDTAEEWKDRASDTVGEWKHQAVDTAGGWKEKTMVTAHDTLEHAAESIKNASDSIHPNHKIGIKS